MTRKVLNLFLTEVIQKENDNRLRWFERNYEKVYAARPPEWVPSKAKVLHEEIVRRRLEQQSNKEHHPHFKTETQLPKADMGIKALPPMRPVAQEEIDLLDAGAEAYLGKRYEHTPSDRYYYAETSSWVYGWKADKRIIGTSDSKLFGHRNTINGTFTRRNGVHPELAYNRPSATFNFDFPFL